MLVGHDDFSGANVVVDSLQVFLREIGAVIEAPLVAKKVVEGHGSLVFGIVLIDIEEDGGVRQDEGRVLVLDNVVTWED